MIEIVEKEQFSVLGKRVADEAHKWIPPLWQEVNNNYIEISNLAIHHHVQAAPVCFVKESMRT